MGKDEVRLSLFADDVVLLRENSRDLQNLLELANRFSKVEGIKNSI